MTETERRRAVRVLAGVVAAGAALRLVDLGGTGFWLDELRTLAASRLGLGAMVAERLAAGHPPLFFLLTWGLVRLGGEPEVILRLPAALAGTATIPAAYLLAARLGSGRAPALLAAALVALNPHQVHLARLARSYAPVVLVGLASSALLARAEREPVGRRRDVAAFAALTLVGLSFHATAFLVVGAQLLFLLVRRRPRWRLAAAGASVAAGVAAVGVSRGAGAADPLFWVPKLSWRTLPGLPRALLLDVQVPAEAAGSYAVRWAILLGFVALAVLGSRAGRHGASPRLLVWLALGPLLLALPASLTGTDLLQVPRYFGTSAVALLLLVAFGAAALVRRLEAAPLRAGLPTALILVSLAGCGLYFRHPKRTDWRAAARVVEAGHRPGEPVVILPTFTRQQAVLEHYLGGEVRVVPPTHELPAHGEATPPLGAPPGVWLAVSHRRLTELPEDGADPRLPRREAYRHREDHPVPGGVVVHLWELRP